MKPLCSDCFSQLPFMFVGSRAYCCMHPILVWKLLTQNMVLYTISAISIGRYCLKGNEFEIALTLYFTVLTYCFTCGMCLFLDVTFRTIHIFRKPIRKYIAYSESPFMIHAADLCGHHDCIICLVKNRLGSTKLYIS